MQKGKRPESPAPRSSGEFNFDQGDPKKIFELVEKVGSGSYGDVYKARITSSGTMAAVKVVLIEPGENLDEVMMEVNILKACHHSNIVSYYGCFYRSSTAKHRDSIWIAMEYCGGGSIEAVYRTLGTPFTENQIACVMKDCLQGIAYLHETKRIHRDIKSGNLLLTEDGRVKLADFGVSAQLTKTLKKRRTVIGSPYWMAPEVISAEDHHTHYDEKADIWSIGITAIEMAESAPPLYDLHPMKALFVISRSKAPTLARKSLWSKEFHDFIGQTVNKNVKKRSDAKTLLQHPFILGAKNQRATIQEIVDRYLALKGRPADEDDQSDGEDPDAIMALHKVEASLASMGFQKGVVQQALKVNGPNLEKAANWILKQEGGLGGTPQSSDPLARERPSEDLRITVDYRDIGQIKSAEQLVRRPSAAASRALSEGVAPEREGSFKAQKLCRIKKLINCADYWEKEQALIVGMEEGLVWIKLEEEGKQSLASLSSRPYYHLQIIEEIDTMVSISGKSGSVCVMDLKLMDLSRKSSKKFEAETKLKKIKDSRGSDYFQVAKIESGIYLLIAKPTSVLITKWAEHPFNKFMKVKEVALDDGFDCISLHDPERDSQDPVLCVGLSSSPPPSPSNALFNSSPLLNLPATSAPLASQSAPHLSATPPTSLGPPTPATGQASTTASSSSSQISGSFQLIDIESGMSSVIPITAELHPLADTKGAPIASLPLAFGKRAILLCFEESGWAVSPNGGFLGRVVKWRSRILSAMSLGSALVTVSSDHTVDIWSASNLTLLHTFNTASEIHPLRLSKNNRALLASLEKGPQSSTNVISILNNQPPIK